tara:strand:- start:62 stop:238 length:177 start_codon:yes stop_codon:yes gene_type:complete
MTVAKNKESDAISSQLFDVLLMSNGLRLVKELRAMDDVVQFIMLTGYGRPRKCDRSDQ